MANHILVFGLQDIDLFAHSPSSTTKTEQHTASGSSLSAGDNITLTATGNQSGSQGNLAVQGSQLDAGKDITLMAKNDIDLNSAKNTQTVDGKNKSSGMSVGGGYGTDGFSVNASVNQGKGFEKGNSQFYTDTEVTAGKQLTLESGKDTTLTGAHLKGETVKATVGGDLTLSSQQTIDQYDSKQTSMSAGGSVSQAGGVNGSINASKTEMHSDYQSVDKQTDSAGIRGAVSGSGGVSALGIKGQGAKGSKGNEQVNTSTEQKIVEIKSGSKGDWNKQLNKPEPNTTYKVDGNKIFQTDSLGRTSLAEGSLSLNKNDRNTYQQCKAGKCGVSGDEGGHLFASILNGPGEKINMVPMDGTLNKSGWKKMENTWASALKENKSVYVKIEPVYKGNSARPESFNVTYTIDGGRPIVKDISNLPEGGKK
ncbi:hypothetical protein FF38_03676 [Lucilia cuprina]|uniref:Type VII secretion system protein EssD-like domain-containing protein n=1 Tax=Lucilia cuprina TaxID=7375 RepID=A0A0L0BMP8_LUCCU|nr:hypothetical protein FF38_03676 [Lucilia cuprina]